MAKSLENRMDGLSIGNESGRHPQLKDYEFRKKLGRGGFGVVWHFFDRKNGRDVAVKRLSVIESLDANALNV